MDNQKNFFSLEDLKKFTSQLKKGVEEFTSRAEEFSARTEIKLRHCEWFNRFERGISNSLRIAQERLEEEQESLEMERKLNSDPALRKYYEEALQNYKNAMQGLDVAESEVAPAKDCDWIQYGPPPRPTKSGNEKIDRILLDEYNIQASNHIKFVESIRKVLDNSPALKPIFVEVASERGLKPLVEEFFL